MKIKDIIDFIYNAESNNIDDVLLDLTKTYIEDEYSNFDGIQHDCIDFYRNKFNDLFDKMEDELWKQK